jgi:hypothetical protein
MNGIDFQKNLSRESLFLGGDLVRFLMHLNVVTCIAPSFVDGYT